MTATMADVTRRMMGALDAAVERAAAALLPHRPTNDSKKQRLCLCMITPFA
jgi:hypothetical protein